MMTLAKVKMVALAVGALVLIMSSALAVKIALAPAA